MDKRHTDTPEEAENIAAHLAHLMAHSYHNAIVAFTARRGERMADSPDERGIYLTVGGVRQWLTDELRRALLNAQEARAPQHVIFYRGDPNNVTPERDIHFVMKPRKGGGKTWTEDPEQAALYTADEAKYRASELNHERDESGFGACKKGDAKNLRGWLTARILAEKYPGGPEQAAKEAADAQAGATSVSFAFACIAWVLFWVMLFGTPDGPTVWAFWGMIAAGAGAIISEGGAGSWRRRLRILAPRPPATRRRQQRGMICLTPAGAYKTAEREIARRDKAARQIRGLESGGEWYAAYFCPEAHDNHGYIYLCKHRAYPLGGTITRHGDGKERALYATPNDALIAAKAEMREMGSPFYWGACALHRTTDAAHNEGAYFAAIQYADKSKPPMPIPAGGLFDSIGRRGLREKKNDNWAHRFTHWHEAFGIASIIVAAWNAELQMKPGEVIMPAVLDLAGNQAPPPAAAGTMRRAQAGRASVAAAGLLFVLSAAFAAAVLPRGGGEPAPARPAPALTCNHSANTPGAFAVDYELPRGVWWRALCRWDGGF